MFLSDEQIYEIYVREIYLTFIELAPSFKPLTHNDPAATKTCANELVTIT